MNKLKSVFHLIIIIIILILITHCNNDSQDKVISEENNLSNIPAILPAEVSVGILQRALFQKQLVSNGQIFSKEKTKIYYPFSGFIKRIYVKNGQWVKSGQLLALMDTTEAYLEYYKALIDKEKAMVQYHDRILSLGYEREGSRKIPTEVEYTAEYLSGLKDAEYLLKRAERDMELCRIKATFDGVVSDISDSEGAYVQMNSVFCQITNNKKTEAVFTIFDSYLNNIHKGTEIIIQSLNNPGVTYKGEISAINPYLDKNGLCTIRANVLSPAHNFIDGMHVKIIINYHQQNALIIPKSALLYRQGRPVVFTVNDNNAQWNYVVIEGENDEFYSISDGLREGDVIILNNNEFIGHNATIKIKDTIDYLEQNHL